MKWCLLLLLPFISCMEPTPPPVDILVGRWVRTNDTDSIQTLEKWEHTDSGLLGLGIAMREGEVIFEEQLRIEQEGDDYYYVVTGVHAEPIRFKFTQWTDFSFTCENLANAFPQKIRYRRHRDFMIAELYNETDTVSFNFMKEPFMKDAD